MAFQYDIAVSSCLGVWQIPLSSKQKLSRTDARYILSHFHFDPKWMADKNNFHLFQDGQLVTEETEAADWSQMKEWVITPKQ